MTRVGEGVKTADALEGVFVGRFAANPWTGQGYGEFPYKARRRSCWFGLILCNFPLEEGPKVAGVSVFKCGVQRTYEGHLRLLLV